MSVSFRPGKREQVGVLVAVAGASGAGKSYSLLRLATGLADGHPFAVLDTEARRALHYADQFKFDHADLGAPFSPGHYLEAIIAAEAAGYPVIVVDSFSHSWAGEGGCLDMQEAELDRMAGNDWKKREAVKIAAWVRPKGEYRKLIAKLLQVRAHVLFGLRAESKIEVVRVDGKMVVQPKRVLGWSSEWIPVTEKSFMFEMTASFVLSPDRPGYPIPMKLQEQHKAMFPLDEPISEASGQRLAAWAKGGTTASGGAATVSQPGATSGGGTGGTYHVTTGAITDPEGRPIGRPTDECLALMLRYESGGARERLWETIKRDWAGYSAADQKRLLEGNSRSKARLGG